MIIRRRVFHRNRKNLTVDDVTDTHGVKCVLARVRTAALVKLLKLI